MLDWLLPAQKKSCIQQLIVYNTNILHFVEASFCKTMFVANISSTVRCKIFESVIFSKTSDLLCTVFNTKWKTLSSGDSDC